MDFVLDLGAALFAQFATGTKRLKREEWIRGKERVAGLGFVETGAAEKNDSRSTPAEAPR